MPTTQSPPSAPKEELSFHLKDLPSLPSVAMQVLEICKKDDTEIAELAELISRDPSLAVKVLQHANSANFSHLGETVSLQRACFALGLNSVKVLALGFSISNDLFKSQNSSFNFNRFWQRSVLTAVAAQLLSQSIGKINSDEAFVCGLLSRIGQLAFADSVPELYNKIISSFDNPLPTESQERSIAGIDQHFFSNRLLEKWNLPESLSHIIGDWPHGIASERYYGACECVRIADKIAQSILDFDAKGIQDCRRELWDSFAIEEDDTVELLMSIREKALDTAECLDLSPRSRDELVAVLDEARGEVVKLSLESSRQLEEKDHELQVGKSTINELMDKAEKFKKQSEYDGLTEVRCRRVFDESLRSLVEHHFSISNSSSLGIMMIDIDHFKSINDKIGHLAGDKTLKSTARAIEQSLRSNDLLFRYGGEEFAVVIPETDLETFAKVAERIRTKVEELKVNFDNQIVDVTVSIGGVTWTHGDRVSDGLALVDIADNLMYTAKKQGRNRCIIRSYPEAIQLKYGPAMT